MAAHPIRAATAGRVAALSAAEPRLIDRMIAIDRKAVRPDVVLKVARLFESFFAMARCTERLQRGCYEGRPVPFVVPDMVSNCCWRDATGGEAHAAQGLASELRFCQSPPSLQLI